MWVGLCQAFILQTFLLHVTKPAPQKWKHWKCWEIGLGNWVFFFLINPLPNPWSSWTPMDRQQICWWWKSQQNAYIQIKTSCSNLLNIRKGWMALAMDGWGKFCISCQYNSYTHFIFSLSFQSLMSRFSWLLLLNWFIMFFLLHSKMVHFLQQMGEEVKRELCREEDLYLKRSHLSISSVLTVWSSKVLCSHYIQILQFINWDCVPCYQLLIIDCLLYLHWADRNQLWCWCCMQQCPSQL